MFHRFLKHDLKRRAWKLAAPPADEFQRQPRVDLGPLFLYMGFEYPIGAVGHFKEHEEKREKGSLFLLLREVEFEMHGSRSRGPFQASSSAMGETNHISAILV